MQLPRTCEGMDDSARANDQRAGDEKIVDKEEIEEDLHGNSKGLLMTVMPACL